MKMGEMKVHYFDVQVDVTLKNTKNLFSATLFGQDKATLLVSVKMYTFSKKPEFKILEEPLVVSQPSEAICGCLPCKNQ